MKVKKNFSRNNRLCACYMVLYLLQISKKFFTGKTMTANAADSYSENSGTTENGLEYLIYTDVELYHNNRIFRF